MPPTVRPGRVRNSKRTNPGRLPKNVGGYKGIPALEALKRQYLNIENVHGIAKLEPLRKIVYELRKHLKNKGSSDKFAESLLKKILDEIKKIQEEYGI